MTKKNLYNKLEDWVNVPTTMNHLSFNQQEGYQLLRGAIVSLAVFAMVVGLILLGVLAFSSGNGAGAGYVIALVGGLIAWGIYAAFHLPQPPEKPPM